MHMYDNRWFQVSQWSIDWLSSSWNERIENSMKRFPFIYQIKQSMPVKHNKVQQQIFQINQSMLATASTSDNSIKGVFNNIFNVLKGNGGVCYSTNRFDIFSSTDWWVNIWDPDWRGFIICFWVSYPSVWSQSLGNSSNLFYSSESSAFIFRVVSFFEANFFP